MKKEFIKQKLFGILIICMTAIFVCISTDGTAALLTAPLGLLLIFSKKLIIGNVIDEEEDWD